MITINVDLLILILVVTFVLGGLLMAALDGWITRAFKRWMSTWEEVHPRELPAVVRAEIQDLDQWTGFNKTIRR